MIFVRKITYEVKEEKGEIVNIYQKPQSLINYLIDLCLKKEIGFWIYSQAQVSFII